MKKKAVAVFIDRSKTVWKRQTGIIEEVEMGKNFMKRLAERDLVIQTASRQTYVQFMIDLIEITLNDPEIMGKDTFGHARIRKVILGISKYYDIFFPALIGSSHDSDYLRQKMDERMLQIFPKEKFIPFDERYDYVKQLAPLGKEKE